MKVYKLGPSELDDFYFNSLGDKYVWFAYYYESNGVYGGGQGVGQNTKGELHLFNLCHDSFTESPLENPYCLLDLKSEDVLDEEVEKPILREKVEELINEHSRESE